MSSEEDKQEKRGFKVEDRRRFSDTGDARPGDDEATPQSATVSEQTAAAAGLASVGAARRETLPIELNFSTFVLSLSTQALAHLGEIPDPIQRQMVVDLSAAKHMIDILGILNDKTKGNLDQAESELLTSALYDLRIKYVERVRGHA